MSYCESPTRMSGQSKLWNQEISASRQSSGIESKTPMAIRTSFTTSPRMNQTTIGGFTGFSPKDKVSPTCVGGSMLNSPQNNQVSIGFDRENNRVAGFGPGMGGALIGNQSRMGVTKGLGTFNPRTEIGTIGWGLDRTALKQNITHRVLSDMPHKKDFDHGQLQNNLHMVTSGFQSSQQDTWLGLPFDYLDGLSIRQQRVVVKKRVKDVLAEKARKRMAQQSPTKPIDTYTNTQLYLKQLGNTQQIKKDRWRGAHSSIAGLKKGSEQTTYEGNESTTVGDLLSSTEDGLNSPSKSRNQPFLSEDLAEVTEFPQAAFESDFRMRHLLNRGCPKLLKMAKQHKKQFEKTRFNKLVSINNAMTHQEQVSSNYDKVKRTGMSQVPRRNVSPLVFQSPKNNGGIVGLNQNLRTNGFQPQGSYLPSILISPRHATDMGGNQSTRIKHVRGNSQPQTSSFMNSKNGPSFSITSTPRENSFANPYTVHEQQQKRKSFEETNKNQKAVSIMKTQRKPLEIDIPTSGTASPPKLAQTMQLQGDSEGKILYASQETAQ